MPNGETTINELMGFLQENMFTKEDATVLEQKLTGRIDRLEQKVDQNHLELSGQIRMIETELKDIKERLIRLEKRTIEDADAAAKDVLELRQRVEVLENKVRQLQAI